MLSFLPAPVIGVISSILLGLNTLFWCLLLYIPAILKLIIPHTGFRVLCTKVIIWIAEYTSNLSGARSLRMASAKIERAELPVQMNNALNFRSTAGLMPPIRS